MRPQGEGLWPYGKIYNALYRWEGRPRTRKRHQGLRVGEGGERRGSEMKTQFWEIHLTPRTVLSTSKEAM